LCVEHGYVRRRTPTTEMRKPILYSIKIDVTSKNWCPIPTLLVIAEAQKPGATHNKGGLQFGKTGKGTNRGGALFPFHFGEMEIGAVGCYLRSGVVYGMNHAALSDLALNLYPERLIFSRPFPFNQK